MSEVSLPLSSSNVGLVQRTLGALGQLFTPLGGVFALGRTADQVLEHVRVAQVRRAKAAPAAAADVSVPNESRPARHTERPATPLSSQPERPAARDAERWAATLLAQLEWDPRR